MARVKLEPIPEYGTFMSAKEFACSPFIDYDGYGLYATSVQMTNILAYPSEVKKHGLDKRFSHVVWLNR